MYLTGEYFGIISSHVYPSKVAIDSDQAKDLIGFLCKIGRSGENEEYNFILLIYQLLLLVDVPRNARVHY